MTRRKILLLCGFLAITAISLGFYVPQYFSPIPELVAEMRSLLEPTSDDRMLLRGDDDPTKKIHLDVVVALLDLSKTGSLLPAPEENEHRTVRGIVKDNDRLIAIVRQLEREDCLEIVSQPRMVCMNNTFALCTEVGTTVRRPQTTVVILAGLSRCSTIDISTVHADYLEPGFSLRAVSNIQIREGQTCFIYGERRNCKRTSAVSVPLVSDLPGVGPWFRFTREVETDQAMLVLLTPKLVSGR
jgi:type II secretory pathway component GspD/PulD (secretin)